MIMKGLRAMRISDELNGVSRVAISAHVRPDGDAVGACLALYNYLNDNYPNIKTDVYLEKPGAEFAYLKGYDSIITELSDDCRDSSIYDVFFVLDCGSQDRIAPFYQLFKNSKRTVCIDHHISSTSFADNNLVMPNASSTCEVLFNTLDEEKLNKAVAECIYTGIVHDTGVFKYSCTSGETMKIAGKLMDMGIPYSDIIDNSFYAKTYIQNQVLGRALTESVLFYDGRCIFSSMSKEVMDFYGVTGKELGGIVEQLRLTSGVEVAIFLYQLNESEYKVSLRSKKVIDVNKIATHFGGGGHVRAAGFAAKGSIYDIINTISALIEEQYSSLRKENQGVL